MSKVYMLGDTPFVTPLMRVRCKDEAKELQSLLLNNPELLPSEQIAPEDPPRWLVIGEEMPVSDPATGQKRWSLDLLFVDHMAMLTLVECKRCDDTRSRREVIAQMMEYAANGQHYWSADDLHRRALQTAGGPAKLAEWLEIQQGWESIEKFFEAAAENLRMSRMRLIFFLEESPHELRSLVEFLNGQLKDTEVLLVEAKLYESSAGRIVVPWLFGFTEKARVAKRESKAEAGKLRSNQGESAFWEAIEKGDLSETVRSSVRRLVNSLPSNAGENFSWSWGIGAIFMIPAVMKTRGLFGIERNGALRMFFGYWHEAKDPNVTPEQKRIRLQLTRGVSEILGIEFSEQQLQNWPSIKPEKWADKVAELIMLIKQLSPTLGPQSQQMIED